MDKLSNDIIESIFCQVPTESILQCQLVCKSWRSRLRHVYPKVGLLFLTSAHNQNIRLDYLDSNDHYRVIYNPDSHKIYKCLSPADNGTIVGSCNGLVCLNGCIFNPITGESVSLPSSVDPKLESDSLPRLVAGFGYLHSTNEYKIVRIKFGYFSEGGDAEVYTLGSPCNRWRKIGKVPYTFCLSGIFANGALHWVDNGYYLPEPRIVAFDLKNETFQLVPSPPTDYNTVQSGGKYCIKLLTLRGNLCVVHYRDNSFGVWSLIKKELADSTSCVTTEEQQKYYYDCGWSWSKEFTVPCNFLERYEPFDITLNNKLLLWRNKRDLYSYDSQTSTLAKVMESKDRLYHQTVPHMNTLVSLKDLQSYYDYDSYQSDAYKNYISDQRWRL